MADKQYYYNMKIIYIIKSSIKQPGVNEQTCVFFLIL